jgi:hypothetical protein
VLADDDEGPGDVLIAAALVLGVIAAYAGFVAVLWEVGCWL